MADYMARIMVPITADTNAEAEQTLMEYIRTGIKTNCQAELATRSVTPEELEEEKEKIKDMTFQSLMDSLNEDSPKN